MPVKKTTSRVSKDGDVMFTAPTKNNHSLQSSCCSHDRCEKHEWFGWVGKKLLATFVGIFVVYMIVFIGVLIRNEIKAYEYIGMADRVERTIRIEGEGRISIKPDLTMVTMGVTTEAETVAEAQAQNTETINRLLDGIKDLGIDDADIKTENYNMYPRYDYNMDGGRTLVGYEISQNVSVKIRNAQRAGEVLRLAGEAGATNVGGLQQVIDERQVYLEQARVEAMKQVADKAFMLSQTLGVQLVSVVSYDEYEVGTDMYYPMRSYDMGGFGGGSAPMIEQGTQEVVMRVGVTYEIK